MSDALGVAALGDPGTGDGLVLPVAFALLGMAGGRLVSAVLERPSGFYPVGAYLVIELASAAALIVAVV